MLAYAITEWPSIAQKVEEFAKQLLVRRYPVLEFSIVCIVKHSRNFPRYNTHR